MYEHIYKKKEQIPSIHLTKFETVQKRFHFDESVATMQHIIDSIAQVRKLKTAHQLSLKTDINVLKIYTTDTSLVEQLKKHEQLLKGVTRAQAIEYHKESLDQSALTKTDEMITVALAL